MIIGLTGKARSGKDTIADYLAKHHMLDVISFAQPVKAGVIAAFGLEPDKPDEDREQVIPHIGKSKRELYQLFGTEFGRDMIDHDIWVKMAQHNLNKARNAPYYYTDWQGAVFTDVRFDNEAEFIKRNGGIIIEVIRDNAPKVRAHVSEEGINEQFIDYVIFNNGTIDELHAEVDSILKMEASNVA